jgi:hypothetical protein
MGILGNRFSTVSKTQLNSPNSAAIMESDNDLIYAEKEAGNEECHVKKILGSYFGIASFMHSVRGVCRHGADAFD